MKFQKYTCCHGAFRITQIIAHSILKLQQDQEAKLSKQEHQKSISPKMLSAVRFGEVETHRTIRKNNTSRLL